MNLFKIEQEDPGFDEVIGFVIVAKNEEEARTIASNECSDEGPEIWYDLSTLAKDHGDYCGPRTIPFVLQQSFKAG